MRLAVTGAHGQVVTALLERARPHGLEVVTLARPLLDLASPASIAPALKAANIAAVISAAAYTAVDKAETEPAEAHAINAVGAGALATAAAELGIPLVHLSTDYVFDGSKASPYLETDQPNPVSVYGQSKLAGEQAIFSAWAANSAILRTAWVFSPFGANFAKTMLRLASDRDEVGVVADQIGNPTSALDIADGALAVAMRLVADPSAELRGVFHMTASGETSWAGFAEQIFATSGARGGPAARVRHIATADYPTPAKRPANSRLNCDRLAQVHGIRLPRWQDSCETAVARLTA